MQEIKLNNQSYNFGNNQGQVFISGNNNTITVKSSQMLFTVNGNNSRFILEDSQCKFSINGNNNSIAVRRASEAVFGINGNNNHVEVEEDSGAQISVDYSNGHNNAFNRCESQRQRQPVAFNNPNRNRSRQMVQPQQMTYQRRNQQSNNNSNSNNNFNNNGYNSSNRSQQVHNYNPQVQRQNRQPNRTTQRRPSNSHRNRNQQGLTVTTTSSSNSNSNSNSNNRNIGNVGNNRPNRISYNYRQFEEQHEHDTSSEESLEQFLTRGPTIIQNANQQQYTQAMNQFGHMMSMFGQMQYPGFNHLSNIGNMGQTYLIPTNPMGNNIENPPRRVRVVNIHEDLSDVQEEEEAQRGLTKGQIDLLPATKHSGKVGNCTICLSDIDNGEEETYLVCIHAFHTECIREWLNKNSKCPVCQFAIKEYLMKYQ